MHDCVYRNKHIKKKWIKKNLVQQPHSLSNAEWNFKLKGRIYFVCKTFHLQVKITFFESSVTFFLNLLINYDR